MTLHSTTARTALVTGGASGIGKAVAQKLVAGGHTVYLVDRDIHGGEQVAQELGAHFVAADLAVRADCRAAAQQVLVQAGTVDILVNNAGYQHIAAIDEFPEDVWDHMLAVMLTAPFLLTRYLWPAMKAQGWGRIVHMGSIHSVVASPFKAGYISAKHGLLGLTRTCAREGGEFGITVNAVLPAYVRTPLVEHQIADQAQIRGLTPDQVIEEVMLAPAAIKRLVEPDEVAAVVAFLCSEEAGAVTGATWSIDLGWTAG
ncbi:MAG: 3-hydroxybutyrate dehydrogenase [Litorilinea sp.]